MLLSTIQTHVDNYISLSTEHYWTWWSEYGHDTFHWLLPL